jgi:VIT1/CCC1 family predicted Fe2+/Mn2+ transporter
LFTAWLAPFSALTPVVAATSLVFLVILGGLAAYTGGASIVKGIVRVTFWGALAMGITAGVGMLFGVSV